MAFFIFYNGGGEYDVNIVEPIRCSDTIDEIKSYLMKKNHRDYLLFLVGVQTGLRISDILALKVKDVQGSYITLREKKTNKFKRIEIASILKREFKSYCQDKKENEYLFKSRQGVNKPIERTTAYKILKDVEEEFGLEAIGCHSLRKTFGYHFYNKTKDVALLMELFNHKEESITLRYIGIKQETLNKAMRDFRI